MGRVQGSRDQEAVRAVIDAAVACFDARGYHGTSVRSIAETAGLRPTALYELFPSKQAILLEVIDATYAGVVSQTELAVALTTGDAAARLEAAIWAQADFYARNARASAVAHMELRSLPPEDRAAIEARTARLVDVVTEILTAGKAEGVFDIDDSVAVSRALTSMCASVWSWQDGREAEPPRKVARTYCELAARAVGLRGRLQSGARAGLVKALPIARTA